MGKNNVEVHLQRVILLKQVEKLLKIFEITRSSLEAKSQGNFDLLTNCLKSVFGGGGSQNISFIHNRPSHLHLNKGMATNTCKVVCRSGKEMKRHHVQVALEL